MTPHDWALLSEWIDGGLTGEAKAAFEARLQQEPPLDEAARRLKTLGETARALTPTEADAEAWKQAAPPKSKPFGLIVALLLVLAAATWLVARSAEPAPSVPATPEQVTEPAPLPPSPDASVPTPLDAGARESSVVPQQTPSPDAGVPVHDAGAPSPGARTMPFRPDASTPLAVAALVATVAQAGTPPVVHVNPGEPWLVHAPRAEVTVTPDGVATVSPLGERMTRITSAQPAKLQVTSSPSDGGTPTVVVLDVSARRDLEFTIPLDVGRSRDIWAPGRVRFAVGSAATALVTEDGDRLRVEGVQAGETSVEAWFADGAHLTWPVRVIAPSDTDGIDLRVGSQKVLSVRAGEKASLDDASLARVQPIGNKQVILIGMRPGRTTIRLTGADAGVRSRELVVTGFAVDEAPASVEAVTLSPSPREQGPWRVRQNHEIRFSSPAGLSRVRTTTELVLTTMKDGAVLVRGASPGRAVIEIGFNDGAEVKLTIVVDP